MFIRLLVVAMAAGLVGWLGGFFELVLARRFRRIVFDIGPIAVMHTRSGTEALEALPVGQAGETSEACFKRVTNDEVLFVSKIFAAPATPFPIKTRMSIIDGTVNIRGRIPIGSLTFMIAWVFAWLSASVMVVVQQLTLDRVMFALGFLAIGIGIMVALFVLSLRTERRRVLRTVDEILSGKYGVPWVIDSSRQETRNS